MKIITASIVLALASVILWGTGAAIRRATGSKWSPWPVSIGVGLAATIAAGGILNLAHIAYGPVLWILAAIEAVIAVRELRGVEWKLDLDTRAAMEIVAAAVVIGGVTLFAVATQLPSKAFNSHDDFEKYFAYPVRMLATGTLNGGPLSALGSEALGGQTFLHGFVASLWPIGYINGVDAVFCLTTLMLLGASASWKRFSWFPGAVLGPLLIAAVNPQYVNVSALYSGALLMGTAVMLVGGEGEGRRPSALVMGLLYGALIALKPSFAIFPMLQLALLVAAWRFEGRSSGSGSETFRWAAKTSAWTILLVAPWVVIHIPAYFAHGSSVKVPVPAGSEGSLNLLSPAPLFYGASFLAYSAIAVAAAVAAVLALIASRRYGGVASEERGGVGFATGTAVGATSGVICYLITVTVLGRAFGYAQSLRLSIPFLLGACVISILMVAPERSVARTTSASCFSLAARITIVALFVPAAAARYRQAAQFGTILAFRDLADSSSYLTYNQFWLSPAGKQYIASFQDKVPAGEPLLEWINTPFLLDYKRNAVFDADTVGLASPWARVPGNVRYVLWQYQGPEVRMQGDYVRVMHGAGYRERMVAACSLAFAGRLSQAAQNADVIASDGYFVLFRLRGAL